VPGLDWRRDAQWPEGSVGGNGGTGAGDGEGRRLRELQEVLPQGVFTKIGDQLREAPQQAVSDFEDQLNADSTATRGRHWHPTTMARILRRCAQ
jgi:hypothetical protein